MSLSNSGKEIRCDALGCVNQIPYPVSPRLSAQAVGWLFLKDRHGERHLCPDCQAKGIRLPSVAEDIFTDDSIL